MEKTAEDGVGVGGGGVRTEEWGLPACMARLSLGGNGASGRG